MHGNLILDTSFITHLCKFDGYFKTLNFRPPLSEKQSPLGGFEYLREKGINLLLPNDVLKELSFTYAHSQGLGMDKNGKLYLDTDALSIPDYIPTTPFNQYLLEKSHQGQVRCFTSTDEYKQAILTEKLSGIIAIIANSPIPQGNGVKKDFNAHSYGKAHIERGDKGIREIYRHLLAAHDPALGPTAVCTSDRGIARACFAAQTEYQNRDPSDNPVMYPKSFLAMLSMAKFLPNEKTLLSAAQRFDDDVTLERLQWNAMPDENVIKRLAAFLASSDYQSTPASGIRAEGMTSEQGLTGTLSPNPPPGNSAIRG